MAHAFPTRRFSDLRIFAPRARSTPRGPVRAIEVVDTWEQALGVGEVDGRSDMVDRTEWGVGQPPQPGRTELRLRAVGHRQTAEVEQPHRDPCQRQLGAEARSEEHTSELQSLMRISYPVFCL